jgi:hypothetical protein
MTIAAIRKSLSFEAMSKTPQKPALLNPWSRYMGGSLIGRVYNHPRLSDGKIIVTSVVMEIDEVRGFARTLNTYYRLINKSTVVDIRRLKRQMRGQ